MPEARDRIERPVDYAAIYANRRSHGVLLDEPASRLSPVQKLPSNPVHGSISRGSLVGAGGLVRGNLSSWRHGNANGSGRSPLFVRENMPMVSARRGRGRASPRTPLRDITHIMRAIEKSRRAVWE